MIARFADRVRVALALAGPLGAGSRILLIRLISRFGWKTVGAGLLAAVYVAVRFRTWIVWILVAWAVAAWMHAPGTAEEPDHEDVEETAGEELDGPDPDDVADLVRDVVGDDRGVLLTALRHPLRAADTRAVRQVLQAAGIRVREGVRTTAGNGPGVHRDDLPPLLPSPSEALDGGVVAGECANNNANNKPRVEKREGLTIIYDPADSHRTHKINRP